MHQTTVRFSTELWEALEEECARVGVSVAQFVREAALTRIVYAAGKRGDERFERALNLAVGAGAADSDQVEPMGTRKAIEAAERALDESAGAAALAAQGQLARQRSRELRGKLVHRPQR